MAGRHLFRRGEPVPAWVEGATNTILRFGMDVCVLRRADGSVDVHPDEAPWTGSSLMAGDPIDPGKPIDMTGAPTRLWAHPCDEDEEGAS